MNGLNIIAEHTVRDFGEEYIALFVLSFFITLFFGVLAAYLFYGIVNEDPDTKDLLTWLFLAIAFTMIATFFVFVTVRAYKAVFPGTTHTEYTATVDETLSYTEFTEKYDVVSIEDGVYRIREKEDDEP